MLTKKIQITFCLHLSTKIHVYISIMNIFVQILLGEVTSFTKQANQEELNVIQSYIRKCLFLHSVILGTCIVGTFVYILTPTITNQLLPLDFEYPFLIDKSTPIGCYLFLYVTQSIIIIQIACTVPYDIFFAMLMWYAGARVEMLARQLGRAATHEDVRRCILQHQYLLEWD